MYLFLSDFWARESPLPELSGQRGVGVTVDALSSVYCVTMFITENIRGFLGSEYIDNLQHLLSFDQFASIVSIEDALKSASLCRYQSVSLSCLDASW